MKLATPLGFFSRLVKIDYTIAFKMGITALLSYYAGQSLSVLSGRPDLLNSLWCVLTSIVVIKSNLGGTNEAALYRFLGILIGSLLGGIFAVYVGSSGFALGVSVFFTAIACLVINIKDSIRIASLSVAVIIVLHSLYPEHNPWIFSFFRFMDSTLGIIIAMFVSHFIFPKMAADDIYLNLAKALSSMEKLFRLSLESDEYLEIHKLASEQIQREVEKMMIDTQNLQNQSKLELYSRDDEPVDCAMILNSIDRIYEAIISINASHHYKLTKIFDDSLSRQVELYRDQTSAAFGSLISQLSNSVNTDIHYPFIEEANSLAGLNDELVRFRNTRSTRRFDLEDLESFYVFFYSLRLVGEELQRIETHLSK